MKVEILQLHLQQAKSTSVKSSFQNDVNSNSTVDGRNPAPVDRWFIPLFSIIYRLSTIQHWWFIECLPFLRSTVCLLKDHKSTSSA